jgi:predicted Zn-dependent protease with MMP-like domain
VGRLGWHRRERGAVQQRVSCTQHEVDLAAMRRFVEDGRPRGNQATVEAIAWGECPACTPRYVAQWQGNDDGFSRQARADAMAMLPRLSARVGGPLRCRCCRSSWDLDPSGWSAKLGGGLETTDRQGRLREGRIIDGSSFVVEPIDSRQIPSALRRAFVAFDAVSGRVVADDLANDVAESMLASYRRRADERAELARIELEHELDEDLAEAWRDLALESLSLVRRLTSELSAPARSRTEDLLPASGAPNIIRPLAQPEPEGDPAPQGGRQQSQLPADRIEMARDRFEALVAEALDSIPADLSDGMANVVVVVEDEDEVPGWNGRDRRFGQYERARPLRRAYGRIGTERVVVFKGPICRYCSSEEEVVAQVQRVVVVLVARHFGVSRQRLRELGYL